jgi:ankyrin repeat protein
MNFQALVRALCAAGARVNTPNMRGLTPLHMAAMKQHRWATATSSLNSSSDTLPGVLQGEKRWQQTGQPSLVVSQLIRYTLLPSKCMSC